MYSSNAHDVDFGLTQEEASALQRIASDLGVTNLPDLVSILLRDVAAAELNPDGWENEAVADWLQFRLTAA
jgi:hypothetical protein